MPIIAVIWGKEGTGKSTLALTFPKPIVHFDLDVGGYERAAWRLDTKDITSTSYPLPIQVDKITGPTELKAIKTERGISVRISNRVSGYRELWQIITGDYIAACQDPKVKTIVMDSATQLWTICHTSELQLKQEIQIAKNPKIPESELRERLQPIEFPNERMRQLIYTARSCSKHLVLTHYPRNIYKETMNKMGEVVSYKSDELEPDGFNATVKLADVVFWVERGKEGPIAKIDLKCALEGLGMTAIGMMLVEPSYDAIGQLQKSLKGE